MQIKKQELIKIWIGAAQAFLVLIIAMTSGYWAWYTYDVDKQQAAEREATEQRMAQAEAISRMSSQLGLMQAQCDPDDRQLRELGEKKELTLRERQCYEAYIGARALLFLSSVRIRRDPDTSLSSWNTAWDGLRKSLKRAGSVRYSEVEMSKNWQAIVGMAEKFERRQP